MAIAKPGDTHKRCSGCKDVRELSSFSKNKSQKDGLNNNCKVCAGKAGLKWQRANKVRRKNIQLRHVYGIQNADYAALIAKQGGACAICRKEETHVSAKSGKVQSLSMDHDHETKKAREFLCNRCNLALGYVKEDFNTAISLAKYIQKHKGII